MKKIIKFVVMAILALSIVGCSAYREIKNGGIPEGKTFTETELQQALPALTGFGQNVVRGENGISEWGGIWLPKNIDRVNGGKYTFLVILNGNGTEYDFTIRRERFVSMFPGIQILGTDYLAQTIYYPKTVAGRTLLRMSLAGRAVNGYAYYVAIPAQLPKTIAPVEPQKKIGKSLLKRKHK
jgi:hypothetical protein